MRTITRQNSRSGAHSGPTCAAIPSGARDGGTLDARGGVTTGYAGLSTAGESARYRCRGALRRAVRHVPRRRRTRRRARARHRRLGERRAASGGGDRADRSRRHPVGWHAAGARGLGCSHRARQSRSIARRRGPRRADVSTRHHRAPRRTASRRTGAERARRGSPAPDDGRRAGGADSRRDRARRAARPRHDAGALAACGRRLMGGRRLANV